MSAEDGMEPARGLGVADAESVSRAIEAMLEGVQLGTLTSTGGMVQRLEGVLVALDAFYATPDVTQGNP